MPIYITAKCLDSHNHPRDSSVISRCRLHHLSYCLRCTTAQASEELSVVPEIYPRYLRDAEDVVPVSDGFHDLITDPLRKDHRAFGMAGGAERTGLTGEGQKVFIVALIAANACKPMSEDAAI